MARKRKDKKPSKTARKAPKKRQGRAWTKVSFQELDAWREERKIPKKRMAEILGVTNSTYHNWARNIAVATPNTQDRIRRLIDGNGHRAGMLHVGEEAVSASHSAEVMAATGRIVESYLRAQSGGISVDELIRLIKNVRQALTG